MGPSTDRSWCSPQEDWPHSTEAALDGQEMSRGMWDTVPRVFVNGKVVMIVGAGPGLGATLARRCAEDGADLVLAARTASTLARIADDTRAAGGRVVAVRKIGR